jgi:folate-binding protein YgfZ
VSVESPFASVERERGAVMAEHCGVLIPERFGDSESEYRSVHAGVGVVDGSFQGLLEIRGGERLRWLNGQITQDVKSLKAGEGIPAAVLNAKGHVLAEIAVYGLDDRVWIACQQDRLEVVRAAFDAHIIADDVTVADATTDWCHLIVAGPDSAPFLKRATGFDISGLNAWQHCEAVVAGVPARVLATRWLAVPTCDVFAPRESATKVWTALTADGVPQPVGMAALEILRVEAGWPWFGLDFNDQNLLLEALGRDRASFTKGCYVGQEVVIRIEHQGHLNKRLCGLTVAGSTVPPRGASVFAGDRAVGIVASAVSSPRGGQVLALAMLRRECWDSGTAVTIETPAGHPSGQVVALPFASDTRKEPGS